MWATVYCTYGAWTVAFFVRQNVKAYGWSEYSLWGWLLFEAAVFALWPIFLPAGVLCFSPLSQKEVAEQWAAAGLQWPPCPN